MKKFLLIVSMVAFISSIAYSPPAAAQLTKRSFIETQNETESSKNLRKIEVYNLQTQFDVPYEWGKAEDLPSFDVLIKQHEAELFYRLKNLKAELARQSDYRTALYKPEKRKYKINVRPKLE